MNAKMTVFARNRTGWLFLGVRAPPWSLRVLVLDEAELPDFMLLANFWRYRASRLDQTFALADASATA